MSFKPTIQPAIQWATTANYPAGPDPWSGLPVAVAPLGDYFPPDTHPPAEYFNGLFKDGSRRLAEARADALALARWAETSSVRAGMLLADDDMRGATITGKGKVFRAAVGAFAASSEQYARVLPEGYRCVISDTIPTIAGNLIPYGVVASGEKVLIQDSPSSYIYDADAETFSAALTIPAGGQVILEAIPTSSGWLVFTVDGMSFGNGAAAGVRGPRCYPADPAKIIESYRLSSAGVFGAASGSASLNGLMSGFTLADFMKFQAVECGNSSDVFVLVSGELGSKKAAVSSADGGDNWTSRSAALPDPYPANDSTWSVEWCTITSRLVLIVSRGLRTFVYASTDLGATWAAVGAEYTRIYPDGFHAHELRRMANGSLVSIGFKQTAIGGSLFWPIFASLDGGVTWVHVGSLPSTAALGYLCIALPYAPFALFGGRGNSAVYPFGASLASFGPARL